MIKKISKRKITLLFSALIVLVIVLLGGSYLSYTKGYLNRFLPGSYADFQVADGEINLKLSIDEKDQKEYGAFLNNMGVPSVQRISFKLDSKTTRFLSALSPQELTLTFIGDKKVKFSSQKLAGFPSALSGKDIHFATKSAALDVSYQDEKDLALTIKNPEVLLEEATQSGQLYASPEIEGIFPISSKIATIAVSIESGAINGEIVLK